MASSGSALVRETTDGARNDLIRAEARTDTDCRQLGMLRAVRDAEEVQMCVLIMKPEGDTNCTVWSNPTGKETINSLVLA